MEEEQATVVQIDQTALKKCYLHFLLFFLDSLHEWEKYSKGYKMRKFRMVTAFFLCLILYGCLNLVAI